MSEGKVTAKVLTLLLSLPAEAQRRVARHVFEAFGGPLTSAEKMRRQRLTSLPQPLPQPLPDGNAPPLPHGNADPKVSSTYESFPGFCSFWLLYPKRIGKGEALKAWKKGNCEGLSELVVKAVREQTAYLNREGGKFTPLPATWLNQKRWDDEPPTPSGLSEKTAGNVESLRRFVARGNQEPKA